MFWKMCRANKKSHECHGISNIREWQNEIKNIEKKNNKISKILEEDTGESLYYHSLGRMHLSQFTDQIIGLYKVNSVLHILKNNGYNSYKEFFGDLSQYLDNCVQINYLQDKINKEKQKLGIN